MINRIKRWLRGAGPPAPLTTGCRFCGITRYCTSCGSHQHDSEHHRAMAAQQLRMASSETGNP